MVALCYGRRGVCLWPADSPDPGLGVAALGIHLSSRLLHVFLRLIPVLNPAAVQLRGGPVALPRAPHGAVALRDVARLLGQLVLVDEAALLLAGLLGVGPRLLLPGCKDPIKHHAAIMHEGGDEEDVLPLFPSLEDTKKKKKKKSPGVVKI